MKKKNHGFLFDAQGPLQKMVIECRRHIRRAIVFHPQDPTRWHVGSRSEEIWVREMVFISGVNHIAGLLLQVIRALLRWLFP